MGRRLLLSSVFVFIGATTTTWPMFARQDAASASSGISVPYTMFTLANGLTVILHEDHSVPQVAVSIWYHVGSAREKQGRTGFAHLFEHLMFEGSGHVKEGQFDTLLEGVGASNNASTTEDRTNYYELLPSNALDMALYLESDRMGYLLDVVTPNLVDSQRDVVKNELRQRYYNTPYGMAYVRIGELIYPAGHPYHWPVIGYMNDLTAATYQDVVDFFKKYYTPSNASLVIAGDVTVDEARRKVEHWFGDIKPGPRVEPLSVPTTELTGVVKETLTDAVQLPRIYLAWSTPGLYAPGDAELDITSGVLSGGKTSRLYKRLVYDLEVAQDVEAVQASSQFGSIYMITVTARPSPDPPEQTLAKLTALVDEELDKLRTAPPTAREVERAKNAVEARYFDDLETSAAKAERLNGYYTLTGNPDYFAEDLGRYQKLAPNDIQAIVKRWLPKDRRLELSVVPQKN